MSPQSPDLNFIQNVWIDLKHAVHARNPSILTELEPFCIQEWVKIPPARIQGLQNSVAIGSVYRLLFQKKDPLLNIDGINPLVHPN